ncbi:MAG TPA: hypothetical protein VMV10_09510 [Pirellulales bacterium]|nr:hypothetical protein [Pirellulales bacterium]
MGFLAGRISFERYRIEGKKTRMFGAEHLETLERYSIGRAESISPDEPQVGFIAGDHVLDLNFRLEKNVLNDVLQCGVRIDTHKVPAALRKAWLQMELEALGADNASGRPTKAQRQEAKEALEARCLDEVKDGKFGRMQHVTSLWDAKHAVLYLGGSGAAVEQAAGLFSTAFELSLSRITSGRLAEQWAAAAKKQAALEDLAPAAFLDQEAAGEIAWLRGAAANFDFLGNEFLLWLWWSLEEQAGVIPLADGTEATGMFNRTLSLECPRAESGKETITAESPVCLPEARHGAASGKLPRRSGLLLVREGVQHDFVLQAETLAVSSARIQLSESGDAAGSGDAEDRVEGVRHLSETIDMLFGAFCKRRLTSAWPRDLEQIRRWLRKKSSDSKKAAA